MPKNWTQITISKNLHNDLLNFQAREQLAGRKIVMSSLLEEAFNYYMAEDDERNAQEELEQLKKQTDNKSYYLREWRKAILARLDRGMEIDSKFIAELETSLQNEISTNNTTQTKTS